MVVLPDVCLSASLRDQTVLYHNTVSMTSQRSKRKKEPTPGDQVVTTRNLLHLSTEVLIEILGYLPGADMVSMQQTCRTIRDIIAGTAYLQYILRADINGVDDFLIPRLSYSERLELLRRHEQSPFRPIYQMRVFLHTFFDSSRRLSDQPTPRIGGRTAPIRIYGPLLCCLQRGSALGPRHNSRNRIYPRVCKADGNICSRSRLGSSLEVFRPFQFIL